MKILLLPFKLLAKLALYILSAITALVSMIILFISTSIGTVMKIIAVLLAILFTITLIISRTVKDVEQLNLTTIIIAYAMLFIIWFIPVLGEGLADRLTTLAETIKELAEFPLLRRKVDCAHSFQEQFDFDEDEFDTYSQTKNNDKNNNQQYERQSGSSESTVSSGFNPFDGVTTLEELHRRHKSLAKCYHPDVAAGSSNEATKSMQFINAEYEKLKIKLS